jgi:hypothetical protein
MPATKTQKSMKYSMIPGILAVFLAGCLPAGQSGGGATALAIEEGEASYYADAFEGRPTASGEAYRGIGMTAAHRSFRFGTPGSPLLGAVTSPRSGPGN